MCLIVYKPKEVRKLDWQILHRASQQNPHGAGFMWRTNGQLHVRKGLLSYQELKKEVKKLMSHELAIHLRFATAGSVCAENCHPFSGPGWALMHNGHLNGFGCKVRDYSDTRDFADMLARDYRSGDAIEADIGGGIDWIVEGSRLVFGFPDRPFVILNEDLGLWHRDVWYSNDWSFPGRPRLILPYWSKNDFDDTDDWKIAESRQFFRHDDDTDDWNLDNFIHRLPV